MAVFKDYIKILKANLRQSAEKLSFLDFFQDNEPKQKKKYVTRTWPLYNCPKVLDTPSPDKSESNKHNLNLVSMSNSKPKQLLPAK